MAETKVEVPPVSNDLIAGAASQNIITDSKTSQQEESKISEMVTPEKVTKGPAVNGESQALDVKAVKNGHSQEADIQAPDAKTSGKDEQSDKPVPISAHERERKEHESSRVKVAKRWNNDQDRPRHSRYDNYSPRKPLKNLNKFDPVSLPESDDPVAIRKQVEFYFSDSNLLTDKFLFTKTEGHENNPVPVDVIHSFKRMRHFQPRSAVVAALKDSKFLNLVNDEKDIQRKEPLPEGLVGKPMDEIHKVHEDQSMARSIYAKGFGEEEASTQFDIEAFFANYGSTNSVRLRRDFDRKFKGSVFVEFDNEETAKTFLAIEPPPLYKSNILVLKSKKQYCDEKVDDIQAGKIRPHSPGFRGSHRGGQRNNEHRDLDKHDDRDWRLRRDEDVKEGYPERRNGGSRDDKQHRGRNKHSGFGSRGRGGPRGSRGRGRDRERKGREERSVSSEARSRDTTPPTQKGKESEVKDADTAAAPISNKAGDDQSVNEIGSKKRAREDDKDGEGQGEAKKVDVKDS